MLPGTFFSSPNWVVPGSLETAVSKAGSNHCLFEAVCRQPKQQQAQPSRSSHLLVTLEWPSMGKQERERVDFQGKQLIHHLYKYAPNWPTWVSMGKSSRKPEEWPTCGVKSLRSAHASPTKDGTICQKSPAPQHCFIPSHFVKSNPHQLQGSDCIGLLSPDQHLWPWFHTTGDTYSFPTFWSMASS